MKDNQQGQNYYDFDFQRYVSNQAAVNEIFRKKAIAFTQSEPSIDLPEQTITDQVVPQEFSRIEEVEEHKLMSVDFSAIEAKHDSSAIEPKQQMSLQTIPNIETIHRNLMSEPQLVYYINGVRLQLVMSQVQKQKADVLVGYFDNRIGKIYPTEYMMKRYGDIDKLKSMLRANRDFAGAKVDDPHYPKLYYFVGLKEENYVKNAIHQIMYMMILEKQFSSIVIPYVSRDNKPTKENSIEMIAQIHEILMKEGILPFRLRITLLAQNSEKFRSLAAGFRKIMDTDIKTGEVMGL